MRDKAIKYYTSFFSLTTRKGATSSVWSRKRTLGTYLITTWSPKGNEEPAHNIYQEAQVQYFLYHNVSLVLPSFVGLNSRTCHSRHVPLNERKWRDFDLFAKLASLSPFFRNFYHEVRFIKILKYVIVPSRGEKYFMYPDLLLVLGVCQPRRTPSNWIVRSLYVLHIMVNTICIYSTWGNEGSSSLRNNFYKPKPDFTIRLILFSSERENLEFYTPTDILEWQDFHKWCKIYLMWF